MPDLDYVTRSSTPSLYGTLLGKYAQPGVYMGTSVGTTALNLCTNNNNVSAAGNYINNDNSIPMWQAGTNPHGTTLADLATTDVSVSNSTTVSAADFLNN